MDKPDFSFSLPADQAERFRKALQQRRDQGPVTPIISMGQTEWLDMSSSEPHVTNECPFCKAEWMDKVKPSGHCPSCNRPYTMKTTESGHISIGWTLTAEDVDKMKKL